ncbi:FtsW/RodA/SpoVE family cell cycle protein [Anaerovorax sp. IOR16]|uniref:FtsW/RodA/SpoVE family cell cycle protein n=1 Tax=Anaerovorax sp. IOR16 TaxID=2773458 RepID=UPI0019D17671|nr:FtsW/RodA/SpoVE family cell cycle protein [Anaerovorax sp. IOR16]
MQPFEQIKEYCNKVSEQIRWKKAKPIISTEIEHHLCDQRDAYMSGGDDENLATQKAIAQMGDAVFVGQELDKTHKPKSQWLMIVLTGILILTGLSIHYFIDASASLRRFSILPYALAFGLFICCYYIDFTLLGKHANKIYGLILIISIIEIMLGTGVNGRLIWLIGGFSVSLSYLSLIFPIAFALFVYSMRNKGIVGILMSGIAYLPLAVFLSVIPTLSGLILYTITALTVLCFAISRGWFGVNKKQGLMLVLIPAVVMFSILYIFIISRTSHRFSVFLNPEQDRLGTGYLYCVIRDLLSEAVFYGKGAIPQNIGDITALPNISTDYSLVYLIHQFGYVILFCITLLIVIFAMIGIHKSLKEKSVLGSLIALTIIVTFILQAVFYIIDNLGYGLVSSLSLPFISYGNTALFINAALIGFMLSVFRTGEIFRDYSFGTKTNHGKGNQSMFSYEDGKLIINLNVIHS